MAVRQHAMHCLLITIGSGSGQRPRAGEGAAYGPACRGSAGLGAIRPQGGILKNAQQHMVSTQGDPKAASTHTIMVRGTIIFIGFSHHWEHLLRWSSKRLPINKSSSAFPTLEYHIHGHPACSFLPSFGAQGGWSVGHRRSHDHLTRTPAC